MKICYFGKYEQLYPRNRANIKGLQMNGYEVIECNVDIFSRLNNKTQALSGPFQKILFLFILLYSQFALLIKFFAQCLSCKVIIVGYPGHADIFLAKILSKITQKPLIFDVFISLYNTIVEDRKLVKQNSVLSKIIFRIEKWILSLPDVLILDTYAHIDYVSTLYSIPKEKFICVYVGVEDDIFQNQKEDGNKKFKILFYGKFSPLHGVFTIIEAAKRLKKENDIEFHFIGTGQLTPQVNKVLHNNNLSSFIYSEWVSYKFLPKIISSSSIVLGIFGKTAKAGMVIPNKVVQAMAVGRPVITQVSQAMKERFVDGVDFIGCKPDDVNDLVKKILLLKRDKNLIKRIEAHLQKDTIKKLLPQAVVEPLRDKISALVSN